MLRAYQAYADAASDQSTPAVTPPASAAPGGTGASVMIVYVSVNVPHTKTTGSTIEKKKSTVPVRSRTQVSGAMLRNTPGIEIAISSNVGVTVTTVQYVVTRWNQPRRDCTPQMSFNASSMLLRRLTAANIRKTRPVAPIAPVWMLTRRS